ncbi:MAG TPA: hypothetical protein VK973_05770 [Arenicellales bacterium]|nr:hypothetical protein [Arenicellales bacterium]
MSRKKKTKREGRKRPSQPSQRKRGALTARDRIRTERAVIEDPWDGGKVEATRTVDTVTLLYRRGQIDARQYKAADAYRHAAEICGGGIPCALDQSTVRTGGNHSPTEAQMRAAGVLSDASRILGLLDGRIVSLVAVEGYSIEQVTLHILGPAPCGCDADTDRRCGCPRKARRSDAEHVGRRLRLALETLADTWWPARGQRRPGIRV